jgi:hypothetical protein
VARDGPPLVDRFTVPVNPGVRVIVTLYVVAAPLVIVRLAGVAVMLKSPVTTSVTVVVRVSGPLVPRMVSVWVPAGVDAVVETLIVVEPDVFTDVGLNEAVAPAGNPVTLNATVPVKPVPGVTVAL